MLEMRENGNKIKGVYLQNDFKNRNLFLTAKLLKQGYRYHKIRKAFSKFYHRHSELVVKYNIGLKLFCNKAYQNLYFMVI